MRKFPVVAVCLLATSAFSADPSSCQTASGVPCFTLSYEQSVWALVKSPMRDLVTAEVTGTMAVRSDGSFVYQSKPASRFAVRDRHDPAAPFTRLYLAARKKLAEYGPPGLPDFRLPPLFFSQNVYRRTPPGDDGCRAFLTPLGQGFERAGINRLLGETVVTWKFQTGLGEATASLAPALDCQVLRMESIEYRYRYFPVRKELFEVKTLRRGEPAAALFQEPHGK